MSNLEAIHLQDFPEICRICLGKTNIFPVKDSLTKIFKHVLGTEFFSEKYLPRNLCINCSFQLEETAAFIENYKRNDTKLQNVLKNEYNENVFSKPHGILSNSDDDVIMDIQHKVEDLLNNQTENEVVNLCQESDTNMTEIFCNTSENAFVNEKDLLHHETFYQNCTQRNKNKIAHYDDRHKFDENSTPKRNENNVEQVNSDTSLKNNYEKAFSSKKNLKKHQIFNSVCRKGLVNEDLTKVHRNIKINQRIIEDAVQNSIPSILPNQQRSIKKKRSYPCIQCDKTFKNKWGCERHAKTHTEERPHRCTICEKAFRQKSHLKGHLRIHSGEKPYKCFICNKTFKHLSTISQHQHRHIEVT